MCCSLCLVSLPRLPLPLPHTHTDNAILYVVSLTQRRKHPRLRSSSPLNRAHLHAATRSACTCFCPLALSVFLSDTCTSHTLFHAHTPALHYSLCLGILHFDEGGSALSNQRRGSWERPLWRRQRGGSEVAQKSIIIITATRSDRRPPLVCSRAVV